MNVAIAQLLKGESLDREGAARVMGLLMAGQATPVQTAAFLTALRLKGETVDEITGLAGVMRAHSVKVLTHRAPLVDTCGTGGDTVKTFNVSTAAAFVAAGAGAAVAKHGNRAATSKSGAADVLEALGVNLALDAEEVGRCLDNVGIGFLFARNHHPAMKYVAPVRAELGFRTVFNALGPLTNPAGATRQVLGVYDPALCRPLAEVLLALGSEHVLVVHGMAGLDEIATFGETVVAEGKGGQVREFRLTAESLGLSESSPDAVRSGETHAENAEILRAILSGEPGPRRELVLANAAAALYVGGLAENLREGVERAAKSIDSGAALEKLIELIAESNR